MKLNIIKLRYYIREYVLRKQSRPGSFKRTYMALAFALAFLFLGQFIHQRLDETLLLKSLFSLRGAITPPSDVVIVKIDDITYRKLKISPRKAFPREVTARAVRSILSDNPKLLILDLYFPQEEDEAVGTEILIDAMKMGAVSVVKLSVDEDISGEDAHKKHDKDETELNLADPYIAKAAAYELPMTLNSFHDLTLYLNLYNNDFHSVSTYETVPFLKPLHDHISPDLPVPERRALINYYGQEDTIESFALWSFFEENRIAPKDFFKDKVVILGFKSELRGRGHNNDKEVLGVPVSSKKAGNKMYGVEIHANILGNLLEGKWISRFSDSQEIMFNFLLLFILLRGILSFRPYKALLFMTGYMVIWFLVTYILFVHFYIFFPGIFLALLFSPYILAISASMFDELRLKKIERLEGILGTSS